MSRKDHARLLDHRYRQSLPDPIGDGPPQPDQCKPHYNIRPDICQRVDSPAITQQIECIVAKGGECGETAQYSNKNECAGFRGEYTARFGKLGEKADDKTTDQVDGQRAVWEIDALADGLSPCAEEITGNRTQRATQGDVENG